VKTAGRALAVSVRDVFREAVLVPIQHSVAVDWDAFDLGRLAAELRDARKGPETEKMIWAFEEAVRIARIEDDLIDYLLAATACLLAWSEETSPRTVLEAFFRRSLSDEEWRARYAHFMSRP
jgi:hypothetical protein